MSIEFQNLWNEITEWQDKQFPEATVESKLKHLLVEVRDELLENHTDPLEYADAFMLLMGAADKAGLNLETVIIAIKEKMEINKKRKWGKPNKDGFQEHTRE